jgi:cation:H+ antiporter
MTMTTHALLYGLAFMGIWVGSGLAVRSVERLARLVRISSFTVSFLVLGLFTSVSELSVGVNSIMAGDPEIYVGNLIGASIVMFMLIIPLLAIVGRSIRISPEFRGFTLPASLVVVALPVLVAMDGEVGMSDSFAVMGLFGLLLILVGRRQSLRERLGTLTARKSIKAGKELARVLFGVGLIFVASRFVVEQTLYFAGVFGVSPFVVSLLVIAVGTNVPELSLVVRAMFRRNNQVAFGDYVGSATFNTFLLGALTVMYGQPVQLTNSYLVSLLFLVGGLVLFYYFARTKHTLSRLEGLVLLSVYVVFVAVELATH